MASLDGARRRAHSPAALASPGPGARPPRASSRLQTVVLEVDGEGLEGGGPLQEVQGLRVPGAQFVVPQAEMEGVQRRALPEPREGPGPPGPEAVVAEVQPQAVQRRALAQGRERRGVRGPQFVEPEDRQRSAGLMSTSGGGGCMRRGGTPEPAPSSG